MTDLYDRATEQEEALRDDALQAQQRRAGLTGKTIDDSATHCGVCGHPIPQKRRAAYPGTQTCAPCKTDLEHVLRQST